MDELPPDLPLHKHPKPHKELARRYKTYYKVKDYRLAVLGSLLVFIASLMASLLAGHFAKEHASNYASDIILSNTPAFNVDAFFVVGTFLMVLFITGISIAHPRRIPFMLFSLALFFFIRAGFIIMTHIAPFPERAATDFFLTARRYFFGSDLFFSGHTGAPFLVALIFWKDKKVRYVLLGWSAFFAVVVLLGHLHYTVDVASAFFITYTIYCLAEKFFPEYRALFDSDIPEEELLQIEES